MKSSISIDSPMATKALCILSLLSEQDMSNYQIGQEISRRSNNLISSTGGSICIALHHLEDKNLISHTYGQSGNWKYHIEPAGLATLDNLKKDYDSLQKGIHLVLNPTLT